jgi:HEAT repeat protein
MLCRSRWIRLILVALCVSIAGCGSDSAERRRSIYSLKADPTSENVALLRSWLSDADRDVRATALNALVELRVSDAEELALNALDDPDGFVRATAVKLLGDLGNGRHVDALAGLLLEDPDPIARQRAAEALSMLGGRPALEALTQALADPGERVRRAAIHGLGDLDPGFALEELKELLDADPAWEIRAQAAHALGLTGDDDVLVALERAEGDPNEFVRSAAANALRIHRDVRKPGDDDDDDRE